MKNEPPRMAASREGQKLDLVLGAIGVICFTLSILLLIDTGGLTVLGANQHNSTELRTDPPSLLDRRTRRFDYDVPKPGTYDLEVLRPAADGTLTGEDFEPVQLHDLLRNRITVLNFDHSSCCSSNMCDLATGPLLEVQRISREFPELAERLFLLTVRTEILPGESKNMGRAARWSPGSGRAAEWVVLSAPDNARLEPILHAYRQHSLAEKGNHRLHCDETSSVYLIDPQLNVRNTYAYEAMDPRMVATDALTLLRINGGTQRRKRSAMTLH